jgi:uncharacterized Tic20 family protein
MSDSTPTPPEPFQQPYPQQPPYQHVPPAGFPGNPAALTPVSASDAKLWATLGHVGGILFGFVAPLIVFIIYKDRDGFVRAHSAEALNFQITLAIAWVAAIILSVIGIGLLLMPVVAVCSLVFSIMAAIAANNGQPYRYPVSLRLVS